MDKESNVSLKLYCEDKYEFVASILLLVSYGHFSFREIEGSTRSILTHTLSFALSFCPGATFPEPGGVQQSWQVWEPDRGLASENPVREARIQFGYIRHSQQNQTYQKWTSKLSSPVVKLYFTAIHLCN